MSHLWGVPRSVPSSCLRRSRVGDCHYALMENFLRDDAKFIMYVSSLLGRAQVLVYTCMHGVLVEVRRQPWV